jgi:hypothetical protein
MAQISLFSGYEFRLGSVSKLEQQLRLLTADSFWESGNLRGTAEMYFSSSENEGVFNEIKRDAWSTSMSAKGAVVFATWIADSTSALYHCQIPVEETTFLPDYMKKLLEKVGAPFSWKLEPAFGLPPFQGLKLNLNSPKGPVTKMEIESLTWPSASEREELANSATTELLEIVQDDVRSIFQILKNNLDARHASSDMQLFLLPLWVRVRGVSLDDLNTRNLKAIAGLTPI